MPVNARSARVASAISLVVVLARCGGDATGPAHEPGIRAVAGAGITDTIDAKPLQALVVEVRREGGALATGVLVRFEPKLIAAPGPYSYSVPSVFVCPLTQLECGEFGGLLATDVTDANGRAKVAVRLGSFVGEGLVRISVPELGMIDSATFTITPGAPVNVRALSPDTALDIGATAMLRGHVVDRHENARPEATTISAGPGTAISLDATTAIVTGQEMGSQWVFVHYNSLVDSTRVRVVPAGRLLVWSSDERVVRLVNINGNAERTIVSNVSSDYGAFPQFDPTRQRISLHAGSEFYGGPPNNLIVIDTTGASRRDIGPATGFSAIMASRPMADGTVLVVAVRSDDTSHPGWSLWRVDPDNTITFVVALPGLSATYGGADVSHDGTRVAYIATDVSPPELRVLNVSSASWTVLDVNANSPRWSAQDDRIVYLGPPFGYAAYGGFPTVINADGSGRQTVGNSEFSPGITWSPDGKYVVGRSSDGQGLRLIRLSDGSAVTLRFHTTNSCCHDYWQPDWR